MLKFLSAFKWTFTRLMKSFSKHNLNVYTTANARRIPHGARIGVGTVFSPRGLLKTLLLFTGSQFVVFL